MTKEEFKEEQANLYLQRKLNRIISKLKTTVVEYINSPEGFEYFNKTSKELAKEFIQERKKQKKLEQQMRKQSVAKEKLIAKHEARRKTLLKVHNSIPNTKENKWRLCAGPRKAIHYPNRYTRGNPILYFTLPASINNFSPPGIRSITYINSPPYQSDDPLTCCNSYDSVNNVE